MLTIESLTLKRGDKLLLESLQATFRAGQVVTVLGPNGAGKSTLLLTLLGLLSPESGKVSFQGREVKDYSRQELSKLMAWQGELPPAEFGLTVTQRLALACDGEESEEMIRQALDYFELTALGDRVLGDLSSGERQRVELAAIMVTNQPTWLMDEPTAHLDMRHQADCLKLMKKQARDGRLIITVLHDLQQAAAVADILVLLDGKGGVEVGEVEEMLVAAKLEPVFGVRLQGKGRDLMQVYSGDLDEEA